MEPIHENGTGREDGLVETENGALAYASHPSPFADFFFRVSSMRQWDADAKRAAFRKCLDANREMALRLLFFVRDIRGGLGERGLFRDIAPLLSDDELVRLLPLFPEFGRWDDVLSVLGDGGTASRPAVREAAFTLLRRQWEDDLRSLAVPDGKTSLLAKWLPSAGATNRRKAALANELAVRCFGLRPAQYRKSLSLLRARLRVAERAMCAGEWGSIDFGAVPSKAAKNYRRAFMKHDAARYRSYLEGLAKGTEKANAGAIFPYEIVHEYIKNRWETDDFLEAQWKALPLPGGLLKNAIVVRDGSGSMEVPISGTVTAEEVATSLAILMSENLSGEFKDKFITFSECPRLVDLSGCKTLRDKVEIAMNEAECANTNIERTMNLVLEAAIDHDIPQEEIPTVVIVSDMEFDCAIDWSERNKPLFKTIAKRWEYHGYELPKIVFWNVASRTGAVPLRENGSGLVLASGFSQNVMDMLSGVDPEDTIRRKLAAPRYDRVATALRAA
jgi:hypothetical protein